MLDNFGFFRVRAYVPEVKIADPAANSLQIIKAVKEAQQDCVDCLVFPEMSVTGYTCGDLFLQELLNEKTVEALLKMAQETSETSVIFAAGALISCYGKRYNCAVFFCKGEILGIVPKSYLPNYNEFYEKRWFESGKDIKNAFITLGGKKVPFGTDLIFSHTGVKIGAEICEDLWVPMPPSGFLCTAGAEVIINLSASDDLIGKHDYLLSLISQQSARCRCAYVYSSAGWGESSSDLVFSGKAIIGESGNLFGTENKFTTGSLSETVEVDIRKIRLDRARVNTFIETQEFADNYRIIDSGVSINKATVLPSSVDPRPFIPEDKEELKKRCRETINIQSYGLMKRLVSIGCSKAVIGCSGGLDSTLALLVTALAFDRLGFDRKGIIGVTMPGLATTNRTKSNAVRLMELLGVTSREIPIGEAVKRHFLDISHDPSKLDATYENSQARERTQILMDLANEVGGIVVGTGDLSELALGWCTFNGDHMSMYGLNASVPKTLIPHLLNWFSSSFSKEIADILSDICATPISPELIPSSNDEIAQKTEDLVGPYELHDFFLFHFVRDSFSPEKILKLAEIAFEGKYDNATILKWLKVFIKRFFSQQFKRSCMPDGPKVGSVNLSPRGDWRMPSDASSSCWLESI